MNYSIRYCQNGCYRVFFLLLLNTHLNYQVLIYLSKRLLSRFKKKTHLMLLFYYCREQMFENVSNINYLYINKFLDL